MSETPLKFDMNNDPLLKQAPDTLHSLLVCLSHNDPNFLDRNSKGQLKREFLQHLIPLSQPARAMRNEFFRSECVAQVYRNPAMWPEVRDVVQRGSIFRIKSGLAGSLAGISLCAVARVVFPETITLTFNVWWLFWLVTPSLHFLVDWHWIRRWDRMWEQSVGARLICPDHPAFHPPRRSKKLLAFVLSPRTCDDVLSDLDEGFGKRSAEFGFRYARTWYAWNAFKSLSPALDALIERLVRWGTITCAIEWLRRFLSQTQ